MGRREQDLAAMMELLDAMHVKSCSSRRWNTPMFSVPPPCSFANSLSSRHGDKLQAGCSHGKAQRQGSAHASAPAAAAALPASGVHPGG